MSGTKWNGNAAEDIQAKTQKERTFQVNLPTCYTAKDVLEAVSKSLGHVEIDTVARQSNQGYWSIITKTTEDANTLIQLEDLYMAEGEGYKLVPRVKRAVLLTLPFVDPEIKNSELGNYFRMYGNVTKVVHEYYKEAKFTQVKTGRRFVFIELFEGCHPPPFCIVRGQKISVSYRGRRSLCYHCNVEGHTKMHCPVARFKTCYNCGSPDHESLQCWEPTFVAFFFETERKYHPSCYPTNYRSDDPEDDLLYGLIRNIDEARDYHYTFNPFFYTREAADRYRRDTYKEDCQDERDNMDDDETDEDDNITEGIWGTPLDRDGQQKGDTASTNEPPTQTKPTTNSSPPPSQETSKPGPSKEHKKTPMAPTKNVDKPVPKPRTARTPKTKQSPAATNLNDTTSEDQSMEQPSTSNSTEQPAPVKRKLPANSPQIQHKKTKDTKTTQDAQTTNITVINKEPKPTETKVLINGKACVQRNLDFSAGQLKTKIPVSNKARVGRSPGNRGPNTETRPRSRSRSRHRDSGPPEGQGKDTR